MSIDQAPATDKPVVLYDTSGPYTDPDAPFGLPAVLQALTACPKPVVGRIQWEEDRRIDLSYHVRHTGLARPGDTVLLAPGAASYDRMGTRAAIAAYRENFQPGEGFDRPLAILGVAAVCADSDEEKPYWFAASAWACSTNDPSGRSSPPR